MQTTTTGGYPPQGHVVVQGRPGVAVHGSYKNKKYKGYKGKKFKGGKAFKKIGKFKGGKAFKKIGKFKY